MLFLSFPSSDKALIATRISECLADVSTWTTAHHLRLNLNKTELLLIPGKDCPHMDLLVTVENITVSPSPIARNLGVVLDNQLSCTANITAVARSCRFALYNIRRIRPFLTREAAQLLVQSLVISHDPSTTATHSWLDFLPLRLNLCSASKMRQRASCSTY